MQVPRQEFSAAAGGAIGSLMADFGWGALIGAAGGYLYDQNQRGY